MITASSKKHLQKEHLYRLFSQIAAAMANPHRLELLDLLIQAPHTVEELALNSQMSFANTSQHLQKLKQARLVLDHRKGHQIQYRLADPSIARVWSELRKVAEKQLVEVAHTLEAYRHQRHQFVAISATELWLHLQKQEVVLLDVRPTAEYQHGHLPYAVSIPLDELERRFQELPSDKMVVAYCRGPYCIYADEALAFLTQKGRTGARLEEGVIEWQQAGYPIEWATIN